MTTGVVSDATVRPDGARQRTSAAPKDSASVSKDDFLKLLIAQIKNQNPLNPADGVEFLTQLAQFSQLEQMMSIREDVQAMRNSMDRSAGSNNGGAQAAQ